MSTVAALIVASALAAQEQHVVRVPAATAAELVLDGKIRDLEWSQAARVDLGQGVALLVKADNEHVALALTSRGKRYTDIFVAREGGATLNLHASMQTGERILTGAEWTDTTPPWTWNNNAQWRASVVKVRANADTAQPFARQVVPFDGQEFLIERALLPKRVVVRIEVRDFTGVDRDVVWPAASSRFDPSGWMKLVLP